MVVYIAYILCKVVVGDAGQHVVDVLVHLVWQSFIQAHNKGKDVFIPHRRRSKHDGGIYNLTKPYNVCLWNIHVYRYARFLVDKLQHPLTRVFGLFQRR